jgi:pimeloyl-ACP methyl ester carboxylesterase
MGRKLRRVLLGLFGAAVVVLAAGFRPDRDPEELEARLATPPSKFIDVGGARVHYRDRGAGPPIVLLHGSNASLFCWEAWAAALAPTFRVVSLDLPGHGLTGPDPLARYSAAEMAELVADFTAKLGIDRFTVAGNSMGGNVAWHLAIVHPERVEKLLLIDSAGLPRDEPKPFAFRMASSAVFSPIARWETPRFIVAASLRDTYGDPSRVREEVVDVYYDLLLRSGNRQATRERFARPDDEAHRRLGEIKAPTLVLWGARDTWILPKYGEELRARIPGARLVVLDGVGHVPMEEAPVASLAAARDFLAATGCCK